MYDCLFAYVGVSYIVYMSHVYPTLAMAARPVGGGHPSSVCIYYLTQINHFNN